VRNRLQLRAQAFLVELVALFRRVGQQRALPLDNLPQRALRQRFAFGRT